MADQTDLIVACKTNNLELLETFVAKHPKKDNYIVLDNRGYSPLHWAILNDSCQVVDYLLKNQLVDVLQKTDGELDDCDCLSLAMVPQSLASSDMVKILLENDQSFQLADEGLTSGCVLNAKLNDKFRFMVETLKARNYTLPMKRALTISVVISDDSEKLNYFLERENLKLLTSGDKQRVREMLDNIITSLHWQYSSFEKFGRTRSRFSPSEWTKSLNKIFSLFFEICFDSFEKDLVTLMSVMREFGLNDWIDRCIKTWYLTESNQHRDLVEKLLKQQRNGIQNVEVIMGLSPYVRKFTSNEEDLVVPIYPSHNSFIYKQLVQCLVENATKWTNEEMNEIGIALGPKLDDKWFSLAFYKYFRDNFVKSNTASNIFKIVDKMHIADKIQHLNRFVIESEICLLPLIAFSTATAADDILLEVRKYRKNKRPIEIEEEIRKFYVIGSDAHFQELFEEKLKRLQQLWSGVKSSKTMAEFRAENTLKSLCRAKMREILMKSHGTKTTHSQLVKYVKLLELPKKVEQFVLFNYTDYDF